MRAALAERGIHAKLAVSNDADVVAAGIAATHGKLDQLVRVWTLGNGIGFGRYPVARRRLGGRPHRGDARPEREVLRLRRAWAPGRHHGPSRDAAALSRHGAGRGFRSGEDGRRSALRRVRDPVASRAGRGDGVQHPHERSGQVLHHAARMRGSSTSEFLNRCVQEMVKMSPLQGYVFEIVPRSDEIAVVGAVVNALRG